jgi:hypothetical protein
MMEWILFLPMSIIPLALLIGLFVVLKDMIRELRLLAREMNNSKKD